MERQFFTAYGATVLQCGSPHILFNHPMLSSQPSVEKYLPHQNMCGTKSKYAPSLIDSMHEGLFKNITLVSSLLLAEKPSLSCAQLLLEVPSLQQQENPHKNLVQDSHKIKSLTCILIKGRSVFSTCPNG